MCCKCCSVTQRKLWVYGLGTSFLLLGAIILVIWPEMSERIMISNLVLKDGTESYKNWKEAPIPIYLKFHMFNWTNPEEIRNPNVKPNFVEMGPYVFSETHLKQNVNVYDNHTLSYYQKRTWYFDAEQSNGTLDDMLTAAHVITATVADTTRHRKKFMKKIINFMLNTEGGELFVTRPVGQWIFDGYQDRLIDFLKHFKTSNIDIPYDKFGWLVERNGSAEYDGLFTIHTGEDDISTLGKLTHWNGRTESGFYPTPCGTINGTTGDLFPPNINPKSEITIFATDACRFVNLAPRGTLQRHGIEAVRWMGTNETLDSGENYPSQKCFCNSAEGECPKTGVLECKKCRNNAPVYVSFPHFYLADQSYLNAVTGLNPNEEEHSFMLAVEPKTGIPLQVNARLQINMMFQPDNDFDIYRGVPEFLMPMFWFEQYALLDEDIASRAKLVLHLEDYGLYLGYFLIALGGIFIVAGIVLTLSKSWKPTMLEDEDMLTTN